MKRFLSLVLCVVVICVVAGYSTEIMDFIEGVFTSSSSVKWDEISAQESNLGSKYKNHFDHLNENQKKAYNQILSEILTAEDVFPQNIQIPVMTGEELTDVFQAVIYDNPTVMCIGRDNKILSDNGRCYFQPNYTMTPEKQRELINKLEAECDDILSKIPSDADEFQKELFIHDYIINNCTYDADTGEKSSSAYSCLVEGISACEGYSKAAKLLLEKAGIESYTVSGDSWNIPGKVEGHMWNIVNIDGDYYHLDVTWDDPTVQDGEETLSHLFMNVTDKEISIDHSNYVSDFACSSTKANYFVKSGKMFSSFNDSDYTQLKKLISQCDDKHLEIRFSDSTVYKKAVNYLIIDGKIYRLIRSANNTYGTSLSTSSVHYIENPNRNVLELFFN